MNENIDTKIEKKTETIELDKLLSNNIKNINLNTNTDNNSENLSNMSLKQLKELAKTYKLKSTGTKQELISLISSYLTPSSI